MKDSQAPITEGVPGESIGGIPSGRRRLGGCGSCLILERRFYQIISQTISFKEVLGRAVDLQFRPLSSTSPELPPRPIPRSW
jgi:hypothetical protein